MAIICSEMQSVFLEERSRKTVSYEEQIMPEVYSQIFPFFHHHMTCVQEKSTIIILSSMSHIYILIVEVCLAVL